MLMEQLKEFIGSIIRQRLLDQCQHKNPPPFFRVSLPSSGSSSFADITAIIGADLNGFTFYSRNYKNGRYDFALLIMRYLSQDLKGLPTYLGGEKLRFLSKEHSLLHSGQSDQELEIQHEHMIFKNMLNPQQFRKLIMALFEPKKIKEIEDVIAKNEEITSLIDRSTVSKSFMSRNEADRIITEYQHFFSVNKDYQAELNLTCSRFIERNFPPSMLALENIINKSKNAFLTAFITHLIQQSLKKYFDGYLNDKIMYVISAILPLILSMLMMNNDMSAVVISGILMLLAQVVTLLPTDIKIMIDLLTYITSFIVMVFLVLPNLFETATIGTSVYLGVRTADLCIKMLNPNVFLRMLNNQ